MRTPVDERFQIALTASWTYTTGEIKAEIVELERAQRRQGILVASDKIRLEAFREAIRLRGFGL